MISYPFPPQQPVAAARLSLTLISLEDWGVITVTGMDSEKYLQGQLTVDVHQITKHQHLLAAHCNPMGKIWSSLRLFRWQDGFVLIERCSLLATQLAELKKYALFSKVIITIDDEQILLGVTGFEARSVLKNLFNVLPDNNTPLVNDGSAFLLWFQYPIERFLLMSDAETAENVIEALRKKAQLNNSQQWLALNIEAGEPVIDTITSGQFIPQEINLQILGGISFKKGCYIGQEMVARAKFRGAIKRALWYLSGHTNHLPVIGENLEIKIGNKWRRTGTILSAVQLEDSRLVVQAVMSNNMDTNSVFRVRNDVKTLHIKPLPYSLY